LMGSTAISIFALVAAGRAGLFAPFCGHSIVFNPAASFVYDSCPIELCRSSRVRREIFQTFLLHSHQNVLMWPLCGARAPVL
jgi:hypothetical protein